MRCFPHWLPLQGPAWARGSTCRPVSHFCAIPNPPTSRAAHVGSQRDPTSVPPHEGPSSVSPDSCKHPQDVTTDFQTPESHRSETGPLTLTLSDLIHQPLLLVKVVGPGLDSTVLLGPPWLAPIFTPSQNPTCPHMCPCPPGCRLPSLSSSSSRPHSSYWGLQGPLPAGSAPFSPAGELRQLQPDDFTSQLKPSTA